MVRYTVNGSSLAACINSGGKGTTARCDLASQIPENATICIYQGNIEMSAGANQFDYWYGVYSKECFVNNN